MKTWDEITASVLAAEPKAQPILDVIGKYWGDGGLTDDIAKRFIAAYANGNFIEAKRLLYGTGTADQIIADDVAENDKLKALIDSDEKWHDFWAEAGVALLKIGLGVALVGLGF